MEVGDRPAAEPVDGRSKGWFGHARDPLERFGGTEAPVPEFVASEGPGVLGAIRHVLANPTKHHDKTVEQQAARRWLKRDEAGFFREKAKLEAAELVALGKTRAVEDEKAAEDVGATAALSLLDELLGKHGENRP